jgi:hypothetical protein
MTRLRHALAAMLISLSLAPWATAQAPAVSSRGPQVRPTHAVIPPPPPVRRRSIVQQYPSPYGGYFGGAQYAGFRNPNGVGKSLEWYPPGNQFQTGGEPFRAATFARGGGPSWSDQRAAQQLGVAKYNAIQGHIDRYAFPYMGYGFGVGYFGGFY